MFRSLLLRTGGSWFGRFFVWCYFYTLEEQTQVILLIGEGHFARVFNLPAPPSLRAAIRQLHRHRQPQMMITPQLLLREVSLYRAIMHITVMTTPEVTLEEVCGLSIHQISYH